MTEAQQDMVLRNQGLIGLILNKMKYRINYEELSEIGMIGLCKGVKSYDRSKGFKESSYLTSCIRNEIYMYFRKIENRKLNISLNNTFSVDENKQKIEWIEVIRDETVDIERSVLYEEQQEELREKILRLPEQEKLVICYYFGLYNYPKLKQQDIALKLNYSQCQISRVKESVLKKLRKELMKE